MSMLILVLAELMTFSLAQLTWVFGDNCKIIFFNSPKQVSCSYPAERSFTYASINDYLSIITKYLTCEFVIWQLHVRPSFFYFLFYRFFRNKLVSEDEIEIKIKFIRTIFPIELKS